MLTCVFWAFIKVGEFNQIKDNKMDSTDKTFATILISIILIITLSITWGVQASNDKITRMVEAGANPIDAACAISGNACTLAGRK